MTSLPATTGEAGAVTAGAAAAILPGLLDEIVVWEILARLAPTPLLRCRAVCRAWRRVTSTRDFLQAHHGRQPALPVVYGLEKASGFSRSVLSFDHRAAADAQLQPVARLDNDDFFYQQFFSLQVSCDGLLVLSASTADSRPCFAVCNPATRQRALLRQPRDASLFILEGMYLHRPSGEYRLLLYRTRDRMSVDGRLLPEPKIGCYVSALCSDEPPRYIGGPEAASAFGFDTPVLVRDCLHWSPQQQQQQQQQQGKSRLQLTVFDTTVESFRQMRAPIVPTKSCIFDMDGKLGIYRYDDAMKAVDIWVLPDYETELWEHKYRVELPVTEIRGQLGRREGRWDDVSVVSADGVILLLLCHNQWLFHVDVHGQLVDIFRRDGHKLSSCGIQLKQSLVPHAFFTALEDYAVNTSPFI